MMDKVLFVPSVAQSEWLRESLPWMSALSLPIAGRRFIDYALESAQKFGFRIAGALDWHYSEGLQADSSNLTARGLPFIYQQGKGPVPHGLNALDRVVSPFTEPVQDGLAVIWGLCMTSHKPEDISLEPLTPEECEVTPVGLYCRQEGRWMRIRPQGLSVRDVRSWYRLSLTVMENAWLFTLPGYSSEKDVHLGRNVVLERGTTVKPPVILQDNVWCARNVQIDGDVVVGEGSFVGEGAHLERTIVGNNTYVGVGIDLTDKIAAGRRIFDVATGVWTDITEPGVARYLGSFRRGWLRSAWRLLTGTSRGRRG